MTRYLVGHSVVDFDLVTGIVFCAEGMRKEGFQGRIRTAFLDPDQDTFGGMNVFPGYWYEKRGQDRVIHIDCGNSQFDHHRRDCDSPSSAHLVAERFGFTNLYGRILHWVCQSERGDLNCGCAVPSIIRGLYRRGKCDAEVFQLAREMVLALMANERHIWNLKDISLKKVGQLKVPSELSSTEEPFCRITEVPDFGRVGLLVADEEDGGTLRNRLEREGGVRLVISFARDTGHVGILSCFSSNGKPVDLGKLGVVQAIREKEAAARGLDFSSQQLARSGDVPGMKWFAFKVNGHSGSRSRIAGLLAGSSKYPLSEEMKTKLSPRQVVNTVLSCVAQRN
ncbi:MAG: hypothetical protein ACOC4Z_01160 [Patescibacteria group bacterium]